MTTIKFTAAARENIDETGIDPQGDLDDVRGGMAADVLLEKCLDGADADRVQGWYDYVAAIVAEASR